MVSHSGRPGLQSRGTAGRVGGVYTDGGLRVVNLINTREVFFFPRNINNNNSLPTPFYFFPQDHEALSRPTNHHQMILRARITLGIPSGV